MEIRPIQWDSERKILSLLDQTRLPSEEIYLEYDDPVEVAEAISRSAGGARHRVHGGLRSGPGRLPVQRQRF